MASTAALIGRFATAFNNRYGTIHSVSSPLGLWLLLALLAPAADGDPRAEFERVLGVDAEEAFARASELLEDPHPAVGAAVAMMNRDDLVSPALTNWLHQLPASAESGDIPTQEEADAWASRRTFGLIEKFPVAITPDTMFVLASVLACDVSWMMPYETCRGSQLGGVFGPKVDYALDAGTDDRQLIADSDTAGLVAVHVASSPDGVDVVSVIAEPSVEPGRVHRAAQEVAEFLYWGEDSARAVSLFELPLVGHAWEIMEREIELDEGDSRVGRIETMRSILPAWRAESTHDLASGPGVKAASDTLARLFGPVDIEAEQSAVGEFSRTGFKAAALTAFGVSATAGPPRRGNRVQQRHATLRFNRPFAAVALAVAGGQSSGTWDRVPVFSAWVAQACDAE